jgi:hypothetical protein
MHMEVAHKLRKHTSADRRKRRWEGVIEIFEVLVLAVAAIATAWTGFQAARGESAQSVLYGQATKDRFEADAASTLGCQQLGADSAMFNGWLQAGRPTTRSWRRCSFAGSPAASAVPCGLVEDQSNPAAPPWPGYMVVASGAAGAFDVPSEGVDGDESTLSYQQRITHHPAADPVAR